MPPTALSPARRPPAAPAARAFTLAEIMISLAILAVGLTMAAVMFPAAVTYTEGAMDDTFGRLVCANGLTAARQVLKGEDIDDSHVLEVIPPDDPDHPWVRLSPIPREENLPSAGESNDEWVWLDGQHYPRTVAGCVLLARETEPVTPNAPPEYQLVAVAYAKRAEGNVVEPREVTAQYEYDTETGRHYLIDVNPLEDVRKGTFVVLRGDIPEGSGSIQKAGAYARVLEKENDGRVRIDRELDTDSTDADFYVFVELDDGDNIVGKTSPAMFVMSTRTSLPEED